jgi:hypothetical protein
MSVTRRILKNIFQDFVKYINWTTKIFHPHIMDESHTVSFCRPRILSVISGSR